MQDFRKISRKHWLLPLLLIALLGGCSAVELGYAIAPRLAVRFIDDYFYLGNAQEARALELFEARKKKHQHEELPLYFAYANRLEERFKAGLTHESLDTSLEEGEQLLRQGVSKTLPAISEIIADLDEDQVEYFLGRLNEKEDEYRQRIREGESEEKRNENEFEDLEEWTGKLRKEQRKLVRKHLAGMHDNRAAWLQWRVERNGMLATLLKRDPGAAEIEEFLRDSWVQRNGISAELEERSAENREKYIEMMLELENSLDESQRQNVLTRINESRELILALMPDDVQNQLLAGLAELPPAAE